MKVIKLSADNNIREALLEASGVLGEGGIVCFPTETFYGLGVRYDDRAAYERLCSLKQRPGDKPLPLIAGTLETVEGIAGDINGIEKTLMRHFWPGPLTLLLSAGPGLPGFVTSGRPGRVAVRIPGRSFALDLARSLGYPVTATSANLSGMPAADNAGDAMRYFGDSLDLVIDGGRTPGGLSSSIVEVRNGRVIIIRPGAVSEKDIAAAAGLTG